MEKRRCTVCGEEFPFTKEYFKSDSKGLNGLGAQCKPCFNRKQQEYRMRKFGRGSTPAGPAPDREAPAEPGALSHPVHPVHSVHHGAPRLQASRNDAARPPRGAGPKYPEPEWTKRGLIVRAAYLAALKAEAWQRREDVAEALDRILAEHFNHQ